MDTLTRKESESHERASSPDRLEEKVGHIARYSQKQAPHLLLLAFVPPHLSDAAAERGGRKFGSCALDCCEHDNTLGFNWKTTRWDSIGSWKRDFVELSRSRWFSWTVHERKHVEDE